jgi:pimeloyl-ACP methyl ester carboxylesterase
MSASVPPEWFTNALAVASTEHEIALEGAAVRYRSWGAPDAPGVVLVHGGLAHSRWWDHIAPLLFGYRVVALDLTGHGDSGHRDGYDMWQWSREILAVADHAGLERPIVVGHSMGGGPAAAAAADFPDGVRGVITVDSRLFDDDFPARDKASRTYSSLEEGVREFVPLRSASGPPAEPAVLRHVAETSLKAVGATWRWKRDDHCPVRVAPMRKTLPRLRVPLVVIRAEFGLLTTEAVAEIHALTPAPSADVIVPAAGHSPMLDQPLAFAGVLRALLAVWPSGTVTDRDGFPAHRNTDFVVVQRTCDVTI